MTTKAIVGRGPVFDGVSQILEDLAAIGMVDRVLFVDLSDPITPHSTIRCYGGFVEGDGDSTFTTLEAELRNINQNEGIDCIILNSLEHPNPVRGVDFNILRDRLGFLPRAAHVAVARADAPLIADKPCFGGMPNVFLSPQNSSEPTERGIDYTLDSDFGDYLLHVATGVCSLAGLWTGVEDGKVFEIEQNPGGGMCMVRCFYHRITAAEVQEELRKKTFSTDPLPRPKLMDAAGRDVWATRFDSEDMPDVNSKCAKKLVDEFPDLFAPNRQRSSGSNADVVGVGDVVSDFFKRWGTEIVTHPSTWMKIQKKHASEQLAFGVQETLGNLKDSTEYVREVVEFVGSDSPHAERPVPPKIDANQAAREFKDFWTSYANLAFTLIDAKQRQIGTTVNRPEVMEAGDGSIKVVANPNDVIPGPSAYFGRTLHRMERDELGGKLVAPFDLAKVKWCKQMLENRNKHQKARELEQLVQTHSNSLALKISESLVEKKNVATQRREEAEKRLAALMEQTPNELERSGLATTTRFLGWVAFLSCIFFHIAVLVGLQLNPSPLFALGWQACSSTFKWGLPAVWMGVWLVMYLTQTAVEARDDRRAEKLRSDWNEQINDCSRSIVGWLHTEQTLEWSLTQFVPVSKLVGSIINNPFGKICDRRQELPVPTRLPDSVVIAKAAPPENNIEVFAEQLRLEFPEGWIDEQINQAMTELLAEDAAKQGLGGFNDTFRYNTDFPQLLEQPVVNGSTINRIIDILTSDEFLDRDRSLDDWAAIIAKRNAEAEMNQNVRDEMTRIMQPLTNAQGNQREVLPDLSQAVHAGNFRVGMFTARAMDNVQAVKQHQLQDGVLGADTLGRSTILVQVSGFFDTDSLVGAETEQKERNDGPIVPGDCEL